MENFIEKLLNQKVQQLEADAARWAYVRDTLSQGMDFRIDGTMIFRLRSPQGRALTITEIIDRCRTEGPVEPALVEKSDKQAEHDRICAREEAIICILALEAETGEHADTAKAVARRLRLRNEWGVTQYLDHPCNYASNM